MSIEPSEFKLECVCCNSTLRDTSKEDLKEKAVEKYNWEFVFLEDETIWVCDKVHEKEELLES